MGVLDKNLTQIKKELYYCTTWQNTINKAKNT